MNGVVYDDNDIVIHFGRRPRDLSNEHKAWMYDKHAPSNSLISLYSGMEERHDIMRCGEDLIKMEVYLNDIRRPLTRQTEGEITFYLFARAGEEPVRAFASYFMRIYSFNARNMSGAALRNLVPVIDDGGEACMYDLVSKQPFRSVVDGLFIAGVNNLTQLYAVLSKLPDLTGQEQKTLTIRLAAALQTDELRAMIDEKAAAKNWEITEAEELEV